MMKFNFDNFASSLLLFKVHSSFVTLVYTHCGSVHCCCTYVSIHGCHLMMFSQLQIHGSLLLHWFAGISTMASQGLCRCKLLLHWSYTEWLLLHDMVAGVNSWSWSTVVMLICQDFYYGFMGLLQVWTHGLLSLRWGIHWHVLAGVNFWFFIALNDMTWQSSALLCVPTTSRSQCL